MTIKLKRQPGVNSPHGCEACCPRCGKAVYGVPEGAASVVDFCPDCSDFAPKASRFFKAPGAQEPPAESPVTGDDDEIKLVKISDVKFSCPDCGQKISMEATLLEQPIRCPFCRQKLKAVT